MTHLMGGEHLVPFSCIAEDGEEVAVPFDKDQIIPSSIGATPPPPRASAPKSSPTSEWKTPAPVPHLITLPAGPADGPVVVASRPQSGERQRPECRGCRRR